MVVDWCEDIHYGAERGIGRCECVYNNGPLRFHAILEALCEAFLYVAPNIDLFRQTPHMLTMRNPVF